MNFIFLCVLLILLLLVLAVLKRWPLTHRQRILSYATPPSWINDLQSFFPAYQKMSPSSQKQFIDRLKIHLAEVPCLPLADCPIDTKKRLLALAPWCALTLISESQGTKLKRVMILLPEEEINYQPLIEKNELLVIWQAENTRVSIHSRYRDDNLLQSHLFKIYQDHECESNPSWEELLYETNSFIEIETILGWQAS